MCGIVEKKQNVFSISVIDLFTGISINLENWQTGNE
jgi:hypothetical protein